MQQFPKVLQKGFNMRHPQLIKHYGEPGVVAPHAWKASLSGARPTFPVILVCLGISVEEGPSFPSSTPSLLSSSLLETLWSTVCCYGSIITPFELSDSIDLLLF